jgi:hypothetical protein
MNRIDVLHERYAACVRLARTGVEVVVIGDPAGARLNVAVRRLTVLARDEGGSYLDALVGAAKALRWRRITQPQPVALNSSVQQLSAEVVKQAGRLRGAIADQELLDELAASASLVAATDSEVGTTLLRSIKEVGVESCVVVAASKPAMSGLQDWLADDGVLVLTAAELQRDQPRRDQAYVVGPPRFFRSSLVTAPVTDGVSYLLPAWFGDRSIPRSVISSYAEGAIRVEARVFTEGDATEPGAGLPAGPEDYDEYLPQPAWGSHCDGDREPSSDEVEARKVLLSGNLAMWLDDGERIRSLDPHQPAGDRVTYTEVPAVSAGTYLLLRQGETEHDVLYRAAIARLVDGAVVDRTQAAWKYALAERIREVGYRQVVERLSDAGVGTSDRARAWTNPNLIRPASDKNFERLLQWLDIPVQPTFGYATLLRKTLHQVSAGIRKLLEEAVSAADLSELETAGHLSLDVATEGFRGILATRVLAISPFSTVVPRRDARVPFEDRSGQWLE